MVAGVTHFWAELEILAFGDGKELDERDILGLAPVATQGVAATFRARNR